MPRRPKPHLNKGYWRCRIDGKEWHLGKHREEAFRLFYEKMAGRGVDPNTSDPEVVSQLVDRWQGRNPSEDYEFRLKSFLEHAGAGRVEDVDRDILTGYHRYLQRRRLAPKTIRDRIQTAARVIAWAIDRGWIQETPDKPRTAKPVQRARDIPGGELGRAFSSLPARAGRILRFILETGCRPIEARNLQWSEVDLARGVCVLHAHKTAHSTGKPRTLFLTPGSVAALSTVPGDRSGSVFTTRLGGSYTASGLRCIFKRHTGFTPNQLRHTFAQARSEEIGTAELAKLLGHSDLSTTQFYFEVRDARAVRLAGQLSALAPPDEDAPTPRPKSSGGKRRPKKRPSPRKASRRVS